MLNSLSRSLLGAHQTTRNGVCDVILCLMCPLQARDVLRQGSSPRKSAHQHFLAEGVACSYHFSDSLAEEIVWEVTDVVTLKANDYY